MSLAENPKTGPGRLKPSASVVSPIGTLWLTAALEFGVSKYSPYNWREKAIPTRTYLDAIRRHLDEYLTGVDLASDSGLPHLAHIAASCIILLDAEHAGTLIDDRFKVDGYEHLQNRIVALKAGWLRSKTNANLAPSAGIDGVDTDQSSEGEGREVGRCEATHNPPRVLGHPGL